MELSMSDELNQDAQPSTDSHQPTGEDKAQEYLIGWKRALADYDNLKKDLARERTDARRYAMESAAEAFLPVIEHFEAAVKFTPELEGNAKAWLSGVLHIQRELEEAMKSLGLESFGEVGEPFDPMKHESVGTKEGGTPDTIAEVVRRGWKMGDRVVRPANVMVGT